MSDLINSQDVVECVYKALRTPPLEGVFTDTMSLAISMVNDLPSAQPEHGRWIKMSDADGLYYACSKCGEELTRIEKFDPQFDSFPRLKSIDKTHFCPNCGVYMMDEEKDDETD